MDKSFDWDDKDLEWNDYGEFDFYCLTCDKKIDEPNFCSDECKDKYNKNWRIKQ